MALGSLRQLKRQPQVCEKHNDVESCRELERPLSRISCSELDSVGVARDINGVATGDLEKRPTDAETTALKKPYRAM